MILINKIDGKDVLGINIGLSNKGTAGTDFSDRRRDSGYILTNNYLNKFNLPEITEENEHLVLYSKDLNLKLTPLFEENFKINDVQKLLEFYIALKKEDITLPLYSANMFYTTQNGDILMMPPSIIEFINNRESLSKKLRDVSLYRHPEVEGEKSLLYSIGILLFKAVTDSYPIVFSNVEDLRDKMRRKKIIEPRWKNVKVIDPLNTLIMNLFDIENSLDLSLTLTKLNHIIENGTVRVDKEDYKTEEDIYKQKEANLLKWEERRAFVIKHRGLIAGLSFVLLILTLFFGTIINNALKPPVTSGFSSHQVVETYFESFQTLNPELVDDTLGKGVRNSDSSEISTLYVTSKMRTQTDPSARMFSPKEWLSLSDEDKSNTDVYGINNLIIEEQGLNIYKVSYEKWYTQADDTEDMSADFVLGVYRLIREEIFTMAETKYSYEIINIETLLEKSERIW